MNIKGLNPQTISLDYAKGVTKKKEMKSTETSDRDADGKKNPEERPPKHQLTEEELQEVLKALNALSGVKEKQLKVTFTENEGHYVFYIKDPYGEVLRRLSTNDAWGISLSHSADESKGNLLDKAV